MSLQVWLPLNGDLHNQGLADTGTLNTTNISYDNNGKIGKCTLFGGSTCITLEKYGVPQNTTEFSFSAWVYANDITNTKCLFCSRETSADGIAIFLLSTGKIRFNMGTLGNFNYTYPVNEWFHIAVTRNITEKVLYINGERVAELAPGTVAGIQTKCTVGASRNGDAAGTNFLRGKLNDVRIYDHALSAKEVKEISKGLVLHYKLDNQMETSIRNLYSSPASHGDNGKGSVNSDGSYHFNFTYTGTGSDSWWSTSYPVFNFTAGKTYMWMCKIKCNSCTSNVSLTMRCSRMGNDWQCPASKTVCSASLADGKWHEYYAFATLQATSDRSGTTYTTAPILEFYTGSRKTANEVFSMDFDIRDIMICETSTYIPFIDNDMCTDYISDCSGYGYNGTKQGTINLTVGPRYLTCAKLNSASIIGPVPNTLKPADAITMAMWVKLNAERTTGELTFFNNFEGGGAGLVVNGTQYRFQIYSGGYKNASIDMTGKMAQWHHLVGTFDGSSIKIYIDGELKTTVNTTAGSIITYHDTTPWAIGINPGPNGGTGGMDGSISDARIYVTALSAEDIKELYQTSASIDKSNNFYTFIFQEGSNSSITKTGITKAINLEEDDTNASIGKNKTKAGQFYEI